MAQALKIQLVVRLFQNTTAEQAAEWLRWLDEGAVQPNRIWNRKVKLFGEGIGSHRTNYSNPTEELTVTFFKKSKELKVTHPGWLWIKTRAMKMVTNFLAAQRQLSESRDDILQYFTTNISAIRSAPFAKNIKQFRDPFKFYDPNVSASNKRNPPYTKARKALFTVEELEDELLERTVKTGVLMESDAKWPLCSGCTVDPTGWVLTNSHCISNDNVTGDITELNLKFLRTRSKRDPRKAFLGLWKVTIFHDGRWGVLEVAHIDPTYDFALLKPLWVSGAGPLSYTEVLRPPVTGEPVVVVGNPIQSYGTTYPPLQHSAPGTIVELTPF